MPEKPREYKKRIDEQRRKRRRNRDELIECINEYELIDERYKAETKQEILASFEKNENAEKTGELYVKIGEELANIEQKYKELEELKEKLEAKRQICEDLKNELNEQNIDGDDKTTLKMQMQKIKSIKSKLENIEGEIENLENEIQNREREIEEIEEMYGKKEDSDETSIDEEENQEIKKKTVEKQKKESPKTLQEYKETILNERGRIDDTKQKILKLLEEGIGIDEILKEKIKGKISDVFEKYNDEISGSLRMKSAEYMEDRDAILNLDTAFRIKSINGKKCFMRRKEQYSDWFDDIDGITGIGGKPCFKAKKDGKWCVMRGKEQQGGWFDELEGLKEVGGKLCFIARKDGKYCIIRGTEQQGGWFDDIYINTKEIRGKLCFEAKKDGKRCVMWGIEQQGGWFDGIYNLQEIGGKPCFKVYNNGKWCVMRGNEQQGGWFDRIYNLQEIGGKPCFRAERDGKRCVMWGKEQQGEWKISESDAKEKMDELRTKSDEEDMEKTPREQREKIILDRYQKKLNRDELLKIISGSDAIDKETKKKLKSDILSGFYAEFEKVTSTKEFQEFDKKYRELKKAERRKSKKSEELKKKKEYNRRAVELLDEELLKIANSAMKLEDDSRMKIIKSKRLNKAKEEWNILESKLNKILDEVMKIHKEEVELTGIYTEKEKKYGKKSKRPEIKGKTLNKNIVATEKLEAESTFVGHKKAYMELIKDKEKYMNDLLQQIETIDFGVSEEKKKEIIEILKTSLEKDLEAFKEGDEITKLANETEKWLKENWKSVMEQINELKGKIEEKEKEIEELKPKGKGASSNEIYETKVRAFELRDELLDLKDQFKSIKTELEEKLKKYDGTVVDWTKELVIETREERQKWQPFIDMGINPKDLTVYGELLNEPIYIYKDGDGSCTLFRGDEKIILGITKKIIEIKNIGGDIVLKKENSDGYYSVLRGDYECYGSYNGKKDKYVKIDDIHELNGKPIFLALDSDGYYSIIIGYEKYTGDKNYTGSLAEGYYREEEIKEDLEKRQYINSSEGYKIIGREK